MQNSHEKSRGEKLKLPIPHFFKFNLGHIPSNQRKKDPEHLRLSSAKKKS
jgi:hypothetical protein